MELEYAIQEALGLVEKLRVDSEDDQTFGKSNHETKNELNIIRAQIEDAKQEVVSLKESIRNMEENRNKKIKTINAKKTQLDVKTSELEAIKDETRKNAEKIKKFRQRKIEALAELSQKDIEILSETKMKLHGCCALTGVHFKRSENSISGGYVANNATSQVKLFEIGGLPRKAATEKLWEAIEKTTARLE